jgi:hypothetical protein
LPENCKSEVSGKGIGIVQTVVRTPQVGTILYAYDPRTLLPLRESRALQFSYLMVHEWLRDFTGSPRAIRRVNRLLHSKGLERMSSDAFYTSLDNMGLERHLPFAPVCERTPGIRLAIEAQEKKSCSAIQTISIDYPLDAWLRADSKHIKSLRAADLSGLSPLLHIDLSGNELSSIPENLLFGVFPHLVDLILSRNQIDRLYERTFEGVDISNLDLSGNHLKSVPNRLFNRAQKLESINLSGNEIETLGEDAFEEVPGLTTIDLSRNQLVEIPIGAFRSPSLQSIDLTGNPLSEKCKRTLESAYGGTVKF